MANHPLFSDDEASRAASLRVFAYLRSRHGRFRLGRLYAALDEAQGSLNILKLDPWDGKILAPHATAFLRADRRVLGWFVGGQKMETLKTKDDVEELHQLLGLAVTEKYLSKRKRPRHRERPLAVYDGIERDLRAIMDRMVQLGQATEADADFVNDLLVDNPLYGDGLEESLKILETALGEYEDLVPRVADGDVEIPRAVEERAIAKAAFLRLRAKELDEIAEANGLLDLSTREALATALADKFATNHDAVAKLVLREEDGNPEFGLVTRLIPLDRIPDLTEAKRGLEAFVGRYFETRVAQWFVFRDVAVDAAGETVRIKGRIRGYTVRPAEVSGDARLNANPHRDDVTLTLRRGIPWAETDAPRSSDLFAVRALLRRAEIARPLGVVPEPAPMGDERYASWSARTLWMLELLQSELSVDPFEVTNVVMVNFERPKAKKSREAEEGDEEVEPESTNDRPDVQAVRLRGILLIDHPEVCSLVTRGRHMFEVQLQFRYWTDRGRGYNKLVTARIAWAGDHLSIMTGPDAQGELVPDVHRRLVKIARDAAGRGIDRNAMRLLLRRIERNAKAAETDKLDPVLGVGVQDSEDDDGGVPQVGTGQL